MRQTDAHSTTHSLVYKINCSIIYGPATLPSGVVVALVTLDHATLVQIQARQPIYPPILTVEGPVLPIFIAKSGIQAIPRGSIPNNGLRSQSS